MNYACNQNKYNIFYIDMMKNKIHRFKYSNFASKKMHFNLTKILNSYRQKNIHI